MNPTPVSLPFADRAEAGRRLAERVRDLAVHDPLVLALPRGGVAVGAETARLLACALDVLVVRKLGAPGNPEFAVGALTEDGHVHYDDAALARLGLTRDSLAQTVEAEREEARRRVRLYREARPAPRVQGRDVIVVDDGLATGATARAAVAAVRRQHPASLVVAVPVGHLGAVEELRHEADALVVLSAPENFRAVGEWYRDFGQLSDATVTALLSSARRAGGAAAPEQAVRVRAGDVEVEGHYAVPAHVRGAVVLAVDRGRTDAQCRSVAAVLRERGLATIVVDLLTAHEREAQERRPPPLRAAKVAGWLRRASAVGEGAVGLFGAGRCAESVLAAAAHVPEDVGAVVTCGGRLEDAADVLGEVRVPTLFLVEGSDSFVREIAEWAAARLGGIREVREAAGVERLLSDPAAWSGIGVAAAEWFERHLGRVGP